MIPHHFELGRLKVLLFIFSVIISNFKIMWDCRYSVHAKRNAQYVNVNALKSFCLNVRSPIDLPDDIQHSLVHNTPWIPQLRFTQEDRSASARVTYLWSIILKSTCTSAIDKVSFVTSEMFCLKFSYRKKSFLSTSVVSNWDIQSVFSYLSLSKQCLQHVFL